MPDNTPKIIRHSAGMVSVDIEDLKSSRTSIDFVKGTDLFQELVLVVGERRAIQSLEQGTPVLPSEPTTPAASDT
jgi:hypothetical protein